MILPISGVNNDGKITNSDKNLTVPLHGFTRIGGTGPNISDPMLLPNNATFAFMIGHGSYLEIILEIADKAEHSQEFQPSLVIQMIRLDDAGQWTIKSHIIHQDGEEEWDNKTLEALLQKGDIFCALVNFYKDHVVEHFTIGKATENITHCSSMGQSNLLYAHIRPGQHSDAFQMSRDFNCWEG